jgi:hypothetical protein
MKKGAVKPNAYTLQPWRKGKTPRTESNGHTGVNEGANAGSHPAIFASGIAKYVLKKGRLTIPSERMLRASELLPPKPANHETPPVSMTPDQEETSVYPAAASITNNLKPDNAVEVMATPLTTNLTESNVWTWERAEQEQKRGMKNAELYNGLMH